MNSSKPLPLKGAESVASADSIAVAAANYGANLKRAGVAAAILVVIGATAGLVPRWQHQKRAGERSRELAIPSVSVVAPKPGKAITGLEYPAEIKPLIEAPIYARSSGYLKRCLVDIGSVVKAGDLLAEIDAPELEQELAEARAQLAQSKAALALAKSTAERWAGLLRSDGVSQQEADEKKADAELKVANVAAAEAHVNRLQDLRSFCAVTAPFSGKITSRGTDVGQLIAASGGTPLFFLAQIDKLRVYVRVPQIVARTVAVGQTAKLTLPEHYGRVFPATVTRTSGAMSADSRTLLVELEVDNAAGEIFSGAYAQVHFADVKLDAALTLPSNTLLFRSEGMQVGVAGENGKVELRKVAIGRDFGQIVEILSGVNASDRVILNPSDSLMDGIAIRAVEPGKTTASE